MSYIGTQPIIGQYRKLSDISASFNGSTTTFTTSVPPGTSAYYVTAGTASQLLISVGGIIQQPDTDYTVSTNSITFTTAPAAGLSFFGVLMGDSLNIGTPSDGTVTTSKIVAGAITTATLATGLNLTDPSITGAITEDIYTISDGAAFEINPGNGTIQLITLGASRTPKATNFTAGESVTLMVDDGSAYTLTWTDATFGGSGVVWKTDGGVAPTLNTSGYTGIVLWKVSTQVYGARVGDA